MKELAPGKVNLSLFLGPVRGDGRHELVTLIESVSLADELEVTLLTDGEDEVICERVDGDNLVAEALQFVISQARLFGFELSDAIAQTLVLPEELFSELLAFVE